MKKYPFTLILNIDFYFPFYIFMVYHKTLNTTNSFPISFQYYFIRLFHQNVSVSNILNFIFLTFYIENIFHFNNLNSIRDCEHQNKFFFCDRYISTLCKCVVM